MYPSYSLVFSDVRDTTSNRVVILVSTVSGLSTVILVSFVSVLSTVVLVSSVSVLSTVFVVSN